jgi:hypothetical protein
MSRISAGDYFDPNTHRYYLDGREVPGVTTLLKRAGIIDTTFLKNTAALARGTAVHKQCEWMDSLPRARVLTFAKEQADSPMAGYAIAYARFLRDLRPIYSHIEAGLLNAELRFGGRTDRICVDLGDTGPAVLEIKTGQPADWHGVQLAGYQMLFPTGARWAVYLKPGGNYDLRRCDRADDYTRFMQALADYHAARREP